MTPPSFLHHPFWQSTTARRGNPLEGSFFSPGEILFHDVAVGWLDNYIATASRSTLRLAPAAMLENVAPTSGPRLLARTCTHRLIRSPSRSKHPQHSGRLLRLHWDPDRLSCRSGRGVGNPELLKAPGGVFACPRHMSIGKKNATLKIKQV